MTFGAPLVSTVGLKAIAGEMGGARSVPALGGSLAWLGSALGGVLMGRLAHRFGVRWTVMIGAVSVCLGLFISTLGEPWLLYIGHGVFIGFFGMGGLNAPLYVYVSQWFERRRGSALALLSSGSYIAGVVWPLVFEHTIATWGWRATMLGYGLLEAIVVLTLAVRFLQPAGDAPVRAADRTGSEAATVFGLRPNVIFVMLASAAFLCCIPMAMPQGHLVALCSDRGLPAAVGAAMLSILLAAAFISRQAWGLVADRIGGLRTALISSVMQVIAVSGYLYVTEQFGLFTVSIAFGLGFSALIPAYVLAVRETFPAKEAYWRVPSLMLMSGCGMAVGGWLAGYMYDQHASYDPAFLAGVLSNLANLVLLGTLVVLQVRWMRRRLALG
ncbi:putative sialic acid transporter [Pigmentiphaga humi]|uniref:Putative sialic acid transporter n=2 Tax=Pigmentiphaga humi TaxID=2478468 RepID=A0A3P4AWB1_9BURK|nr:putative sialic acid transporter [Pigmentiphaga humi]